MVESGLRIGDRILDAGVSIHAKVISWLSKLKELLGRKLALPRELNQPTDYCRHCDRWSLISHLINTPTYSFLAGRLLYSQASRVTFQISNIQTTIEVKGAICIPALALIALAMLDTKKISSRGRLIYFKTSHHASGYSRRLQKGINRYCLSMPFNSEWKKDKELLFQTRIRFGAENHPQSR